MKEAIQKAIDGGYDKSKRLNNLGVLKSPSDMFIDPFFWQSLGKALGWEKSEAEKSFGRFNGENGYIQIWLSYMHDFIDHIADEKDVDEFFKKLLKTTTKE